MTESQFASWDDHDATARQRIPPPPADLPDPAAGEAELELTADEVRRILRRAGELAADDRTGHDRGIPESVLISAAEEAGIPGEAVRRAIAMERLGTPTGATTGDRLVGAGEVTVEVELDMTPGEAMRRLDAWLVDGHHLRRERTGPGTAEWAKRDGLFAAGSRAARGLSGEGKLGETKRIRAVVQPVGDRTILRVTADRRGERSEWAWGGGIVGASGTVGVVVAAVLASPFLLALAPLAVAAGVGVASGGRGQADRLRDELERLVGFVANRTSPSSLRDQFVPSLRSQWSRLTRWFRRRRLPPPPPPPF